MADNELKKYPLGQISIGSGSLRQCTNFEFDYSRTAKLKHTLREPNGAGITKGSASVTFSGETVIDEDGPERNYFDMVDTGSAQQCRVKLPGAITKTINGVITRIRTRLDVEEGVMITFEGTGKLVKN